MICEAVFDSQFAKAMVTAWGADPATNMRQVVKNCYLVEFSCEEDFQRAQLGGPWTYRWDLVVLRQVTSDNELDPKLVEKVAVCVLFFNLPINAFKDEGLILIGEKVGTPISAPVKGFVNGKRFVKMKILIPVGEPVKDKVKVRHPTLGDITAHCSYEKVSRICLFCGKLGHEMAGCQDLAKLVLLTQRPDQEKRFKATDILSPKKGEWIINPALVPDGGVIRKSVMHKVY